MQKLLLISVLIVTIGIPLSFSKDRSAARGLKKSVLAIVVFNLVYLFSILHIYPRLF